MNNQEQKICKNCKNRSYPNYCSKFSNIDIVSGNLNLEFARIARYDNSMCGIEGKFYEEIEKTSYFL